MRAVFVCFHSQNILSFGIADIDNDLSLKTLTSLIITKNYAKRHINEKSASMEQTPVIAKVQISVNDADKVLLDETLSVYREVYSFVSNLL